MDLTILYEDDNILVVNKPSGIAVHPDGRTRESTVSDWFMKNYPLAEDVGEPIILDSGKEIKKSGIVHRLDKETSGVLLLVKDQQTFLFIKEQFQNRRVLKTYRAFAYGAVKDDEGMIDRPIGRSARDFRLRSAQRGARGTLREAVTEYKVLQRTDDFSYLELSPKTGRTHQLRVHLKAINYPIVCDRLYAPKRECALGFRRLALHAFSLELETAKGERQRFEAPLPSDFEEALSLLQN